MLKGIINNPKSIMILTSREVISAIAKCEDAKTLKEFSRVKGISRSMKSQSLARWNEVCWKNRSLTEEERDAWSPGGVRH